MENEWGEELTEKYEGKVLAEDYEEIVESIVEKYNVEVNMCDEFEISLILLDRPYLTEDELEDYDEDCEERNWTLSCTVTIDVGENDEGESTVEAVRIEDQAFGDEGLGDYDPNERYSEKEQKFITKVVKDLLRKITA